jgi:two-component system NtrC family sensor kinase
VFHSLFLKVSLSVGVVVTLTLVFFAYFLIENQKEHLLNAKSKEIEILSTLTRQGLIKLMQEGEAHRFHRLLNIFGFQGDLLELRLLDPRGIVLSSSREIEEGTSMAHLLQEQNFSGKYPVVLERKIQGRPVLSSIQPLENEAGCFPCHGKDKKILGILNVSLPMEATHRSITFNRNLLIASTVITLLLMAAAINMLLTRLVKKPVGLLIETMARVEKGDLNVGINIGTQDELGQLAQSFSSMVRKLSQAQRDLEKQQQQQMLQVKHLASLGELAASVAHEVKNPLTGIKLAIQILAKEPGLAASHRETIEEITGSIERLDKTMADLLSYSRIRPPDMKAVHLHEVMETAFSSIKEECQIARVHVEKNFDPTLPPLLLDPRQMERVFLNLFLNALQAMPQGGTLAIQTKRHDSGYHLQEGFPLPDQASREEGWVEVTVVDTGQGIPPETLGDIFRPFFTTKAKGTGLGLSLAQRIVEQHHGQMFAQSKVGVGTTFYLLLPILTLASSSPPC